MAHNRSVTASPPVGGSGYAKRQSGLAPLCGILLRHSFVFARNCFAVSFIANTKPSVTAGTLCVIVPR